MSDAADSDNEARGQSWSIERWWCWPIIVVMIALVVVGCGDDDTRIPLAPVEPAAGGEVSALVTLDVDDEQYLVATAGDELFVRPADGDWSERRTRWPAEIDDPGLGLFEVLNRATRQGSFDSRHYVAGHEGELWLVAHPGAGQSPVVLVSDDGARSWLPVELPDDLETNAPTRGETTSFVPSLRLLEVDRRLYLTDGIRLWHKAESSGELDEGRRTVDWVTVELTGTPLHDSDEETSDDEEGAGETDDFPRRLRHYLPATEASSDEVLTVYGRDLEVYRRGADDESFQRIATLDGPDRDLRRSPDGEATFVLTDDALYRGDIDAGEFAEIEWSHDSLRPEKHRRLEVMADDETEIGYRLWVVGREGGLWESVDGGDEWRELRERDRDGRPLTGIVVDTRQEEIWASSWGSGVLRTNWEATGWQRENDGLNAAGVRDAAMRGPDRLLMATPAGLVERGVTGSDEDESWISRRSTTSVLVDDDRRLIVGTAGGGIELYVDGRREEVSEIQAVDQRRVAEFRPPHLKGNHYPPASILKLVPRPDSEEYIAWSYRDGPMITGDGGETWRPLQIDEAFYRAIDHAAIGQFLTMPDQTYFAVTTSRADNRPTQLWRSGDGGGSWQATYSYRPEDETPMQLVGLPDGEGLLMSHGSHLAVSTDRGERWSSLSGPWESGSITGMTVAGDQVVLVMELPHATEIAWLDDPTDSASVAHRHRLSWPSIPTLDERRAVGLEVRGERVLVHAGDTMYRGEMPQRAGRGGGNVWMVVALGAVLVLVTLAFGYLRRWET